MHGVLICATTRTDPKNVALRVRSPMQTSCVVWFHFYKTSRICKSKLTEHRQAVTRAWGEWTDREPCGYGVFF